MITLHTIVLSALAFILAPMRSDPFCDLSWTWPASGTMTPGHGYVIACGDEAHFAEIDMTPLEGQPVPPQIGTGAAEGDCGDQVFALPPGVTGSYKLTGRVYGCGECGEAKVPQKIITVK